MRFLVGLAVGGALIVYGTATPPPFTGIMVWPVVLGAAVILFGLWLEFRRGRSHLSR